MSALAEKVLEALPGADAAVVAAPENMRYLAHYRGEGYVVITRAASVVVTDSRYSVQAAQQAPDCDVVTVSNEAGHMAHIADILTKSGASACAFEDGFWSVAHFEALKKAAPQIAFIPAGDRLARLRMKKSAAELDAIRRACQIGDAAFDDMLRVLKRGMTEREAAWRLEKAMRERGASAMSFDPIVASGENGAMPHAIPGERVFADGDLVVMDFGCVWDGYCSDMTRTVAFGGISDVCRDIYSVALNAHQRAEDALSPGMPGRAVDQIARDVIDKAGYGAYFGHGLGHGVGLLIHELPRLSRSPEGDIVLEAGHVVSIEPGIYLPGVAGVRIEDLCAVTDAGCEAMTHAPKALITL